MQRAFRKGDRCPAQQASAGVTPLGGQLISGRSIDSDYVISRCDDGAARWGKAIRRLPLSAPARRNRAYRLTPRPTPRDNVTVDSAFTDSEARRCSTQRSSDRVISRAAGTIGEHGALG